MRPTKQCVVILLLGLLAGPGCRSTTERFNRYGTLLIQAFEVDPESGAPAGSGERVASQAAAYARQEGVFPEVVRATHQISGSWRILRVEGRITRFQQGIGPRSGVPVWRWRWRRWGVHVGVEFVDHDTGRAVDRYLAAGASGGLLAGDSGTALARAGQSLVEHLCYNKSNKPADGEPPFGEDPGPWVAERLDAARASLEEADVQGALEALKEAEQFRFAARRLGAAGLREQCEQALSDEKVRSVLGRMSDEELAAFDEQGSLPALRVFEDEHLNSFFLDRLRGHRAWAREEQERRLEETQRREEMERQVARLLALARDALKKADLEEAMSALEEASRHEKAWGRDEARGLLAQCREASSEARILSMLRGLSDEELKAFLERGEIPERHHFTDPDVDAIFAHRLVERRGLAEQEHSDRASGTGQATVDGTPVIFRRACHEYERGKSVIRLENSTPKGWRMTFFWVGEDTDPAENRARVHAVVTDPRGFKYAEIVRVAVETFADGLKGGLTTGTFDGVVAGLRRVITLKDGKFRAARRKRPVAGRVTIGGKQIFFTKAIHRYGPRGSLIELADSIPPGWSIGLVCSGDIDHVLNHFSKYSRKVLFELGTPGGSEEIPARTTSGILGVEIDRSDRSLGGVTEGTFLGWLVNERDPSSPIEVRDGSFRAARQ